MAEPMDRGGVLARFRSRLDIYAAKEERSAPGQGEMPMDRSERARLCREAIEWLASDLGILADLEAGGYVPTD